MDLDMGGSNLHSVLGLKNKYLGLGNFVSSKAVPFKDIVLRTEYPNLFFIPGDVLVPGTADMVYNQKRSIISNLLKLEADYLILDLGSGSHYNIIDFFLVSNSGILVAVPQVTSILNVYSFLKNTVFRFLQRAFTGKKKVADYIKKVLKDPKPNALPSIGKIIADISKIDKESGKTVREYVKMLKPHLVINMAESPDDLNIVESLRSLVQKNLEIDLGCLGLIYHDKIVHQSLSALKPLVLQSPESLPSKQFQRIADKISQSRNFPNLPLDLSMYKDSFELADIEARYDFSEKDPAGKGGADTAGLGPEEFLAVMTAQQKKINELQGTIRMLTMKNPPQF